MRTLSVVIFALVLAGCSKPKPKVDAGGLAKHELVVGTGTVCTIKEYPPACLTDEECDKSFAEFGRKVADECFPTSGTGTVSSDGGPTVFSGSPKFTDGFCRGDGPCVTEEPMDVPAISVASEYIIPCGSEAKDVPCGTFTCKDKSRILLTAEDGTHHCIKFSN